MEPREIILLRKGVMQKLWRHYYLSDESDLSIEVCRTDQEHGFGQPAWFLKGEYSYIFRYEKFPLTNQDIYSKDWEKYAFGPYEIVGKDTSGDLHVLTKERNQHLIPHGCRYKTHVEPEPELVNIGGVDYLAKDVAKLKPYKK